MIKTYLAEEFRRKAARMREMSERAPFHSFKGQVIDIAEEYDAMARELEEVHQRVLAS